MTFALLNLYVLKVLVLGSVTLMPAIELNGTSLLVLLKLQGCFLFFFFTKIQLSPSIRSGEHIEVFVEVVLGEALVLFSSPHSPGGRRCVWCPDLSAEEEG